MSLCPANLYLTDYSKNNYIVLAKEIIQIAIVFLLSLKICLIKTLSRCQISWNTIIRHVVTKYLPRHLSSLLNDD